MKTILTFFILLLSSPFTNADNSSVHFSEGACSSLGIIWSKSCFQKRSIEGVRRYNECHDNTLRTLTIRATGGTTTEHGTVLSCVVNAYYYYMKSWDYDNRNQKAKEFPWIMEGWNQYDNALDEIILPTKDQIQELHQRSVQHASEKTKNGVLFYKNGGKYKDRLVDAIRDLEFIHINGMPLGNAGQYRSQLISFYHSKVSAIASKYDEVRYSDDYELVSDLKRKLKFWLSEAVEDFESVLEKNEAEKYKAISKKYYL